MHSLHIDIRILGEKQFNYFLVTCTGCKMQKSESIKLLRIHIHASS